MPLLGPLTIVASALVLALKPTAFALSCVQSRSESAFLQQVVTDLPTDSRATFCNDPTSRVSVHPVDTGVQHFVLSGHIPRHLVGKQTDGWQLVPHSPSSSHEADSLPGILHLWIRALCSGYDQHQLCSCRNARNTHPVLIEGTMLPVYTNTTSCNTASWYTQGHNYCESIWNAARGC